MGHFNIVKGFKTEMKMCVMPKDIAAEVGSGDVDVFATPAMVTLIEKTCANAVKDMLPKEYTTVGTQIDVRHIAATPCGMQVVVKIEITNVEDREITFNAEVFDDVEKIGQALHKRYIVNRNKFIQKALKKLPEKAD